MLIDFKRLSINYATLFFEEAVSKILGFVAFVFMARIFGPNYYGQLEFAIAAVFIFNLIVDSGFWNLGMREIAKDEKVVDQYVSHIVFIQYLFAIGSYCALVIFACCIQKPWLVNKLILLYGLTLFGTPLLLHWVFQARNKTWLVAITSVIKQVSFTIGIIIFIRNRDQIWQVPIIEISSLILVILFNLLIYIRYFGTFLFKINFPFLYSLIRQTIPLGLSQMMWALKIYLAPLLLGIMIGDKEVGLFGAGHRIIVALHIFTYLYFYNLLPYISRSIQQSESILQNLLGTSIKVTAWVAIFIGMAGTLFAKSGIVLIYGSEYTESILPFQIMVWVLSVALLNGHYRFTLIGYGKQKLEFYSSAWGTGINITLNLILIPFIGSVGAACSLLGSEVLICIISYYYVNKITIRIPMGTKLVKPIFGGIITVICLYLLPSFSPWVTCCTAVVVYTITMFLFQPDFVKNIQSLVCSK